MADVFLSFSGRASVDEAWISDFCAAIKEEYNARTAGELNVWDQFSCTGSAGSYREKIDAALEKTPILIMIVDPGYVGSEEAQAETWIYKDRRKKAGKEKQIIKAIKRHGEKSKEIDALEGLETLKIMFFEKRASEEYEYMLGQPEYAASINKVVDEICKWMAVERLEKAFTSLKRNLDQRSRNTCIYVPVGDRIEDDDRSEFIRQLFETIKRNSQYRTLKIIPDVLTLMEPDLDFESLLTIDNPYREEAIRLLIESSFCALFPITYDTPAEGQKLYERLKLQLSIIMDEAINNSGYKLLLSFNTLDEIKEISPFNCQLNNAAIEAAPNIRKFSSRDIVEMIEQAIAIIEPNIIVQPAARRVAGRKVYLIKNDNRVLTPKEEDAIENIAAVISAMNYTRFDSYNMDHVPLPKLLKEYAKWIEKADGIIVYMGMHDQVKWLQNQQGMIYNVLSEKQREDILKRSVFLDENQPERKAYKYTAFGFKEPLENCDPQVKNFLDGL